MRRSSTHSEALLISLGEVRVGLGLPKCLLALGDCQLRVRGSKELRRAKACLLRGQAGAKMSEG